MALLDAINAARPTVSKSICGVRRVLSELSGADAADLKSALQNPSLNHQQLPRVLLLLLEQKSPPHRWVGIGKGNAHVSRRRDPARPD